MKKNVFVGSFEELKNKGLSTERLENECRRIMQMELPTEHPKKSTTYMGIGIFNLALAYRLTGKKEYLDSARHWMTIVFGYEKWGNAHLVNVDLSAAWILFGLSLGYDWLKEDLEEEFKSAIRAKLGHHARIIYDYAKEHRTDSWPIEYWQNHNWIDFNGLATAGYVLRGEDPMAEEYISIAREDFKKVYSLLAVDGSNYEGVVYWRYGGMWLFVYAWLYMMEEGDDVFFRTCKYLENTFYYRLYQASGSFKYQQNYGDCHDRLSGHPACVYFLVARMYKNPYAEKLGRMVLEEFFEDEAELSKVKPGLHVEAGLEYIWRDMEIQPKDFSDLPLSRYFDDLGLVCVRSSWDRDAKCFSFKCGAPGGRKQYEEGLKMEKEGIKVLSLSHHHPDNQSYMLTRGDDFFITEDGYDRNILPGYHSNILVDGRYTDVMDVNDVYSSSMRKRKETNPEYDSANYRGEIRNLTMEEDIVAFSSENKDIYPLDQRMQKVERKVFTAGLDFVLFVNTVSSEDEHEIKVCLNTDEEPQLIEGTSYRYPTHGVRYDVISSDKLSMGVEAHHIKAVMTTQEPDKFVEVDIKSTCHSARSARTRILEVISYEKDGVECHLDGAMLYVKTKRGTYSFLVAESLVRALAPKGKYIVF